MARFWRGNIFYLSKEMEQERARISSPARCLWSGAAPSRCLSRLPLPVKLCPEPCLARYSVMLRWPCKPFVALLVPDCAMIPLCYTVVTCGQISWAGARGDSLSGDMCQGGVSQTWYQSTRLAVDYPSMESPALLLPDSEPDGFNPSPPNRHG